MSASNGDINGDGISDILLYYGDNSVGAYILYGILMNANMLDLRTESFDITADLSTKISTGVVNPIPS